MKNKLNLDELKVDRFIVEMESHYIDTVKGGTSIPSPPTDGCLKLPKSGQVTCGLSTYYCRTNENDQI